MPRTAKEAAPQPPRRKRSLRCLRCEGRKFRTAHDLALHILSKHGHVHVPASATDDARSVTLSSPLIASSDVAELDQLLQAAEQDMSSQSRRLRATQCRSASRKRSLPVAQPYSQHLRAGVAKRTWSWTSSSAGSYMSEDKSPKRLRREPLAAKSDSIESSDIIESGNEKTPVEGESTGPRAKDLYVARIRSGRVPLVPIQAQNPAMLNFANGLF